MKNIIFVILAALSLTAKGADINSTISSGLGFVLYGYGITASVGDPYTSAQVTHRGVRDTTVKHAQHITPYTISSLPFLADHTNLGSLFSGTHTYCSENVNDSYFQKSNGDKLFFTNRRCTTICYDLCPNC